MPQLSAPEDRLPQDKARSFLTPGVIVRRAWPAAVAAAGVAGARALWGRFMRRGLPAPYQEIAAPYLQQPVKILRDTWGVSHLYAEQETDLFFAQGFVHAQDRLFQMDINRRVGSGRISEIVGSAGLLTDRVACYFGWRQAGQAQVDGADDHVRKVMSAYAAGVNAYIAEQPLPPEFSLLRYEPEPWSLRDTAAIGAVLAWGLSVNWETELLRLALLEALGPERALDMMPTAEIDYETILGEPDPDQLLRRELAAAYHQALSVLPFRTVAGPGTIGSNNWVVGGQHTASGRPILANDPHLPPTYPALWYENHLQGGDYAVTGFTMAGVPGVVIGHNEHVAWGFTNAFPDIQDIYVERFHDADDTLYEVNGRWVQAEIREEVIAVRGRKPQMERVRWTRHGPIFSDLRRQEDRTLALRWTAHDPHNHLRAVLEMNRAHDWNEFREGLRHWGFPSQNIVYADISGDIGYMMPGNVPMRSAGAGLLPVSGWNDTHEWVGRIPFDDLPALHNPENGLIITANNRVHGADYPYLLTGEWLPDYRARRIKELLEQAANQTLDIHARIQADTLSLQAVQFLRAALPVVKQAPPDEPWLRYAVDQLHQWDGDMRADLVAPTLYSGWLVHFSQAAVRQAVGAELAAALFKESPVETFQADPFLEIALDLCLQWLTTGSPVWAGDVKPLLLPALRRTILRLQRDFGADPEQWRWGNLHQIQHEHPLTRLPGIGRPWKMAPIGVGGDGQTVNQADITPRFPPRPVEIIASCRLLIDVGAWDNCRAVLPGGQSGHPASPHYEDGLIDWRDGRYHPMLFSRAAVAAATDSILLLHPQTSTAAATRAA